MKRIQFKKLKRGITKIPDSRPGATQKQVCKSLITWTLPSLLLLKFGPGDDPAKPVLRHPSRDRVRGESRRSSSLRWPSARHERRSHRMPLLLSSRRVCFCAGPNPRRAAPGFAPINADSVSPPNGVGLARSPSRRVTFQSSDQAQVRTPPPLSLKKPCTSAPTVVRAWFCESLRVNQIAFRQVSHKARITCCTSLPSVDWLTQVRYL